MSGIITGKKDRLSRNFNCISNIIASKKTDNAECLYKMKDNQATLIDEDVCCINNGGYILLDFGKEIHGSIQIAVQLCGNDQLGKLRVVFGESAMEAMSDIGYKNSTNDHAIRDMIVDVPTRSSNEYGNTGFRFVKLECLSEKIEIRSIRAVLVYKDIEYKGSFQCNDKLLNRIWETGAYTVHLNMQDYLWDGAKRDRLIWVGDMHPETSTIASVFGYDECVTKSIDAIRNETNPRQWMNSIPSYSMWWIKIHYDWYMQNGDFNYLIEQKEYLMKLVPFIFSFINEDGTNKIENKFIDWPTNDDEIATEIGIHAMLLISIKAAREIFIILNEISMAKKCEDKIKILKKYKPSKGQNKQAIALGYLSGILDKSEVCDVFKENPIEGISTFLGYYTLKANGNLGDMDVAFKILREYWGAMIKLGATTFWEDFDIKWAENAKGIDQILSEEQYDVHGDNGRWCYEGYRNSLCHGWASGPTAFLSEYVLGVKILSPGCRKIKIDPNLYDLEWVKGTYPTPYGKIYVQHKKESNGRINTRVKAPEEVEVVYS